MSRMALHWLNDVNRFFVVQGLKSGIRVIAASHRLDQLAFCMLVYAHSLNGNAERQCRRSSEIKPQGYTSEGANK
jgi:hypothetical protein